MASPCDWDPLNKEGDGSQRGGSSVRQLKPRQWARRSVLSSVRMFWPILCVLSLINVSNGEVNEEGLASSVSDAIQMGASVVSTLLNSKSPRALSSVFNKLTREMRVGRRGFESQGNEIIGLVLRLMGVDNQKLTNFAFSGLISLVHLMNQILLKSDGRRRKKRTGFPLFRFILSQPQVGHLVTLMQDPELVDLILKDSKEKLKHYPEENVDCIQALICRMKPFVQGMQRSLRFFLNRENIKISGNETSEGRADGGTWSSKDEEVSWENAILEDRMYFFAPSLKEVAQCGHECDLLFPDCVY